MEFIFDYLAHRSLFYSPLLPRHSSLGAVATCSSISSLQCECFELHGSYLSVTASTVWDATNALFIDDLCPLASCMMSTSLGYLPGHLVRSMLRLSSVGPWANDVLRSTPSG